MGNPLPGLEARTGPRSAARDLWARSADAYFLEAYDCYETEPARSIERVRLFLEGWAHAVCVDREAEFRVYRGKDLNRIELAKALALAVPHLPDDRQDLARLAKTLGDLFHHNQGSRQRTTPRVARGVLTHCAELLEWLHEMVLRDVPSAALADALQQIHASPKRRSWQAGLVVMGTVGVSAAAAALLGLFLGARAQQQPDVSPSPDLAASSNLPAKRSPSELLAWVKGYEAAIAARDIPKLLQLHRFPTKRWFLAMDANFDQVRRGYEAWFKTNPSVSVTFQNCVPASRLAVRCQAVVAPPLDGYPDGVATCFVFDDAGRLLGRTELKDVPQCPPLD